MKGLFKSNFLAVWTNAKIFLLFMFAMGIAVIIIPDQTWQMYFIIIGIVGLAVNAATVIGNEFSSKWGKYKLTLPVKRIDIVKSLYIIIYVFLTIFLYLLKCPQSLILSALRAFCFCGKPHISRSIFLYFRYQAWLKSW